MVKVSMNLPSSFFAFLTVIIPIITIGSTYFIAEYYGHVPKWPSTDITHCAIHMPENVIFKIGLIVTCAIMAWCWYVAYSWVIIQEKIQKKRNKNKDDSDAFCSGFMNCGAEPHTMLVVGIIGCFLLTISTGTITTDEMPWTLHVIGASGFFLLTFVAQIILTLKVHVLRTGNAKFVSKWSMAVKYITIAFSGLSLLVNLLAQAFKLPSEYSNAAEWFFALGILSYNASLCVDWNKKVFTSVTEDDEEEDEAEDEDEDEEEAVMIKKNKKSSKKGKKLFRNPEELREVIARSNEIERIYREQAMAPPMEPMVPAPAFNPAMLAHHQQVYAPMYFAPAAGASGSAMPMGLYPVLPSQYQATNNNH